MSVQQSSTPPSKGEHPTSEEVTRLFDLASLEVFYGLNLRLCLAKCTREEFDVLYRVFERAQSERVTPGADNFGKLGDGEPT